MLSWKDEEEVLTKRKSNAFSGKACRRRKGVPKVPRSSAPQTLSRLVPYDHCRGLCWRLQAGNITIGGPVSSSLRHRHALFGMFGGMTGQATSLLAQKTITVAFLAKSAQSSPVVRERLRLCESGRSYAAALNSFCLNSPGPPLSARAPFASPRTTLSARQAAR